MIPAQHPPEAHDHKDCSGHYHGVDDTSGYVVAVTTVTNDGDVTREDIGYFRADEYAEALTMARAARAMIATGIIEATYAVVDTVYASGCRPI